MQADLNSKTVRRRIKSIFQGVSVYTFNNLFLYTDHLMTRPFREHHLIQALEEYDRQHLPLDLFISNYFRTHKALGSKDRGYIAETIYSMIRWRALLDYLCDTPINWEKRLELYEQIDINHYLDREDIPLHIRLSFPKILFDLIAKSYDLEKTRELCLISNTQAPATIRVNSLKSTREKLFEQWKDLYQIELCKFSKEGIHFRKKNQFLFFAGI